MRWLIFLFIFFVLSSLTGCVRIPQSTGYPYTSQAKMQAAHHWSVLAGDVAHQINNDLIERGYLLDPVYVKHTCGLPDACSGGGTFAFDEGFNDLLVSHLVQSGVPTRAALEENTLLVEYKVQVLYHASARYQWPQPGVLTALTAGIVVFRHAPDDIIAVLTAGAVDAARATSTINGHYEVIITTSIQDDNEYIMHRSDIYYINDKDFWHYQRGTSAKEINLISKH
ncbi:hypothetical protein [Desulfogranum japonicum]|uniref:hypothetical protein n=1 Tax=Desulfogranum japonicum TaxID=231447 RepID=UPI000421086C|nr:hypothetical protein [Desulfogranum japonicum]